jgi:hypothetical protein
MMKASASIPEVQSEMGILGAFGALAACYLIGREPECYGALRTISEGEGPEMFRRSDIARITDQRLRKRRRKTVAAILSCTFYFEREDRYSEEMLGMLSLLAGLAVDDSTDEFFRIIGAIVQEAALKESDVWSLLEREFPDMCRLIEADVMKGPEGEAVREGLRQRLGIQI